MNEQEIEKLHEFLHQKRQEQLEDMPILRLGQLISLIEKAGLTQDDGEFKLVSFDFGSAEPTTLDSWRGVYSELALGYRLTGYDAPDQEKNHFSTCRADKLLEELKSAIGKEFTGWKGGEFTMNEDTPVWVSNPGNGSRTGVVGVLDETWQIVILTSYFE